MSIIIVTVDGVNIKALMNKMGRDKANRYLAGELELVEKQLLTLIRTFTTTNVEPRISSKNKQFKNRFDNATKGDRAAKLSLHRLGSQSINEPIIAALGGEKEAEITLSDFLSTLVEKEAQDDNESLLGYIREHDTNVLHAVYAFWDPYHDGWAWAVNAESLEHHTGFPAGYQVVSRPLTRVTQTSK